MLDGIFGNGEGNWQGWWIWYDTNGMTSTEWKEVKSMTKNAPDTEDSVDCLYLVPKMQQHTCKQTAWCKTSIRHYQSEFNSCNKIVQKRSYRFFSSHVPSSNTKQIRWKAFLSRKTGDLLHINRPCVCETKQINGRIGTNRFNDN